MSVRVGIIGCGNISRFYFPGLEKYGADIRWLCDLVEDSAASAAQQYKAKVTTDYRRVIADQDVDAVIVTSVTSSHKPICLDAIRAGKAVICEKTLAENAGDAFEIVSQAQKHQTLLFTNYMKRFIPAVQKAHELLPSLGRVLSMHIRGHQPWGDLWGPNPAEGFFRTPPGSPSLVRKNYGGGILVCGGSHLLDLVLCFMGRPQRLYASVYTPSDRDYDLRAAAMMETQNGIVHYEALAHPLNKTGFLQDGWDEQIEIIGTRGALHIYSSFWDQTDSKASLLRHYDNAARYQTEYRYDPVSPFEPAVAYYLDQIQKKHQEPAALLAGYEVDELIEQMQRSSEKKQALDIDWKL